MHTIAIGIQVRLASTRLKEKAIYHLTDRTIITHLLDRVLNSVNWVVKKPDRDDPIRIHVYLLVPEVEQEFWSDFIYTYNQANTEKINFLAGDMNNVFSRYLTMFNEVSPDYVVRLTGDCPLVPSALLSKVMNIAPKHRLDYLSNVDPLYRTMPDGYDVEIISGKAFRWLKDHIYNGKEIDREHVTTYLRDNFQGWMRVAVLSTNIDQSDLFYSIDTEEDYERVKRAYESKLYKDNLALSKGFGVYEY